MSFKTLLSLLRDLLSLIFIFLVKTSQKLPKNHFFAFIMFVRRDKSQKTTMLIGWIVRYDGFIFGSNCSWGRKMEVCRCRTWKRNSGSICQNHFILCQTNLQHQSNYFLDKKNWKSASDRHCDVIFGFYMVKSGVKWPSEVKTWYQQPRSTPIFFSLVPIANGTSINK